MIKLLYGDNRNFMFDGTIKKESIDLTVTSPPYDQLRSYNNSSTWRWSEFLGVASGLWGVTKPGGIVVWVIGDATIDGSKTGSSFKQALEFKKIGFNIHDTMIYQTHKPPSNNINRYQNCFEYMFVLSKGKPKTFNPILVPCIHAGKDNSSAKYFNTDGTMKNRNGKKEINAERVKDSIWIISSGTDKKGHKSKLGIHPARFPEILAKDHIISWSNEGDTVFDPFMGSCTTGKMALLNNRHFIGCEIDKTYFRMSYERIKNSRGILYKDVKILTKGLKMRTKK